MTLYEDTFLIDFGFDTLEPVNTGKKGEKLVSSNHIEKKHLTKNFLQMSFHEKQSQVVILQNRNCV